MKYIITFDENIEGPYTTVNVLGDCYEVDYGARMYFSVYGQGVISEVSDDYKTPTQIAHEQARAIKELEQYNDNQKQLRASAYAQESDALYFKAQRGEATVEEWQAKVAEIQTRYPYKEQA